MKVAVFSDVQANLPAMRALIDEIDRFAPDLVVMAGDLINRGPSSRDCLLLFDEHRRRDGWLPVLGNHEVWVLKCGESEPGSSLERDMRRFADWTWEQVADVADLMRDWPDHLTFADQAGEDWVHVTHGTMLSNRRGISPSVKDADLDGALLDDLALFVTAHTHKPLERRVGQVEVLNVGSVGSPFDGDPRGCWAQLTHHGGRWHAEIRRFDYDRERAERDFHDGGFIEQGGPLARILFEEWRQARNLMPSWRREVQPAVEAGELSLRDAVDRFLARC